MAFRRFRKRSNRRRFKAPRRRFMAKRQFSRKVRGVVNAMAEKKAFTSNLTDQFLAAAQLGALYEVPQGVGKGQRVGNSIFGRYIKCRMVCTNPGGDSGYFRIALIKARAGFGALGASDAPSSFIGYFDSDKWDVKWDYTFILGATVTEEANNRKVVNRTFKIFEPMLFNDTGTTPVNNQYFLYYICSNGALEGTLTAEFLQTYTDV